MSETPITDQWEYLNSGRVVSADRMRELERAANAMKEALKPFTEKVGPDELDHLPPSMEMWVYRKEIRDIYAALRAFDALKEKTLKQ